jgi:hypothetical protein
MSRRTWKPSSGDETGRDETRRDRRDGTETRRDGTGLRSRWWTFSRYLVGAGVDWPCLSGGQSPRWADEDPVGGGMYVLGFEGLILFRSCLYGSAFGASTLSGSMLNESELEGQDSA